MQNGIKTIILTDDKRLSTSEHEANNPCILVKLEENNSYESIKIVNKPFMNKKVYVEINCVEIFSFMCFSDTITIKIDPGSKNNRISVSSNGIEHLFNRRKYVEKYSIKLYIGETSIAHEETKEILEEINKEIRELHNIVDKLSCKQTNCCLHL